MGPVGLFPFRSASCHLPVGSSGCDRFTCQHCVYVYVCVSPAPCSVVLSPDGTFCPQQARGVDPSHLRRQVNASLSPLWLEGTDALGKVSIQLSLLLSLASFLPSHALSFCSVEEVPTPKSLNSCPAWPSPVGDPPRPTNRFPAESWRPRCR